MAGNWKMNLNHQEAVVLVQKLAWTLSDKRHDYAKVEVVVCPPFTDLRSVQTLVDGDKLKIKYGAQDISAHDGGAFTGEISGPMLAKLKCSYVAIGHSERRQYHAETDELVNAKVKAAYKHGLTPILCVGEELEIVGIRPTSKTTCTGVEMFRKLLDQGQAGDNIGALLRGVDRDGVERGQVLAKPGTVKPHKKFKAEAYILTKEEGGRHTPFFTNYRPQFYFRTTDVTGIVKLPEGTEMVMPGDNVTVDVELIVPIAMEEKLRFAIREGGRTVGAGVVAAIVA